MSYTTKDGKKTFGSIFLVNRYNDHHPSDGGKKSRVFVMRHGQTSLDSLHRSDGWLDLPLNDEGNQSVVETLVSHLKSVPIKHIYTSDLKRTKETGDILQSGITSEPTVKSFPEARTWDMGSLAGGLKKPNKPAVVGLLENPNRQAPDGESYNEFKKRFDAWFHKRLKEASTKGPILLILSGSNCRRIGEMLLDDRDATDVDEAGLFVLEPKGKSWSAEVLCGKSKVNVEAS
jgi:broad specificity phosphatase PhoE